MEDPNSTLLPYILETLSHKPELCDTFDNLCKDIEAQLALEENTKYGNIRNALQRALSVGQSLGIITLTNETIRVPFNFRTNNKNAKTPANPNSGQVPQPAIGTGNPPPTQEKNQKATRKSMSKYGNRHEEDPDYMIVPPRSRAVRMPARSRARGRSSPRKTNARSYSRGRSTRGRPRGSYVKRKRTTRRR